MMLKGVLNQLNRRMRGTEDTAGRLTKQKLQESRPNKKKHMSLVVSIPDEELKALARELVEKTNALVVEARTSTKVLDNEKMPAHRYRIPKLVDIWTHALDENTFEIEICQDVEADKGFADDRYQLQANLTLDGEVRHIKSVYERGIRQSDIAKIEKRNEKAERAFRKTHDKNEVFLGESEWFSTTYTLEWNVSTDGSYELVKADASRI